MNEVVKTTIVWLLSAAVVIVGSYKIFENLGQNAADGSLKYPIFHYGSDTIINKGFYKNFECIVINEYKDSVFCHIQNYKDGKELVKIQEQYRIHVNIQKSDLNLVD